MTRTDELILKVLELSVSDNKSLKTELTQLIGQTSAGTNGREIELQKADGYIQWRYVGDTTWTNLIALTEITGVKGDTGATGATGTNGTDGVDYALTIQDTTETTITLQPNVLYEFGSVAQLNLTFGGVNRSDLYHFRFTASTADFVLSYASEIIAYKGVTEFVAGTVYEGSLVDNLLIVY